MFRARCFTIDDAHIYCTEDQIENEIKNVLAFAQKLYKRFNFSKINMALSTRPDKSIGSDSLWEQAESALKNALASQGINYEIDEGGGAFYGPKIDICVEDAMGREWQCGTIQVDFFMPQRFKLWYVASDQSRKVPVIIHRAIYGSIERFMGILIEHYKGLLPFWLAPVQARVLTITDLQHEYAISIADTLERHDIRIEVDKSGDQISAQIRRAQLDKIPCMLVIGKKEQEKNTVTLRYHDGKQEFGLKLEDLIEKLQKQN